MSKPEAQKRWQQRNADKARAYTAKYLERKIKVSVTLDQWVAEEIAKIKPLEQPLGGWIRECLEKWAEAKRTKISRHQDDFF